MPHGERRCGDLVGRSMVCNRSPGACRPRGAPTPTGYLHRVPGRQRRPVHGRRWCQTRTVPTPPTPTGASSDAPTDPFALAARDAARLTEALGGHRAAVVL